MLKSGEIAAECMGYAQSVAQKAGSGYTAESRSYPERTGAAAFANTPEAKQDNLRNNTLLRALS